MSDTWTPLGGGLAKGDNNVGLGGGGTFEGTGSTKVRSSVDKDRAANAPVPTDNVGRLETDQTNGTGISANIRVYVPRFRGSGMFHDARVQLVSLNELSSGDNLVIWTIFKEGQDGVNDYEMKMSFDSTGTHSGGTFKNKVLAGIGASGGRGNDIFADFTLFKPGIWYAKSDRGESVKFRIPARGISNVKGRKLSDKTGPTPVSYTTAGATVNNFVPYQTNFTPGTNVDATQTPSRNRTEQLDAQGIADKGKEKFGSRKQRTFSRPGKGSVTINAT